MNTILGITSHNLAATEDGVTIPIVNRYGKIGRDDHRWLDWVKQDHANGRTTMLSIKPDKPWAAEGYGVAPFAITKFLDEVAQLNVPPIFFTFHHEPENDGSYGTADEWLAVLSRIERVAAGVALVGPHYQSYTWNPQSGRDVDEWVGAPGENGWGWVGLSYYPGLDTEASHKSALGHFNTLWTPVVLREYGISRNETSSPTGQVDEFLALVEQNGYSVAVYFDADSDPAHPYWAFSDGSREKFARVASSGVRR